MPRKRPRRYELEDDDLLISIGTPPEKYSGSCLTDTYKVSMGPQHPSTHGVLRLELTMDGEVVLNVRPHMVTCAAASRSTRRIFPAQRSYRSPTEWIISPR